MKYFLIILSFLYMVNAFSFFKKENLNNIKLETGNWFKYPGQTRANTDNETEVFRFSPFFAIGFDYKLIDKLKIVPQAGYILQRSSDQIDLNQFYLKIDLAYEMISHLYLSIGSSLMATRISSNGSEIDLPSGNGTETYYTPEEGQTAFNQTLDFGIEYFYQKYSFKFATYTYAWNISNERLTSISLSFGYHLPIKDLL